MTKIIVKIVGNVHTIFKEPSGILRGYILLFPTILVRIVLFCPVFAQKCRVIYKKDFRTDARYITLGHTTTLGTPCLCNKCLGSFTFHKGCRH